MELVSILFVGIGLSMDAFSLALCYGVLDLEKSRRKLLASIVGIFHFFMPLFGMELGNVLEHLIIIDVNYIVFIIFMFLGVEMFISIKKSDASMILLNLVGLFLFAFTVSIDSFSAGIGIKLISNNYLLCSFVFSITSFAFTYVGLVIGEVVGSKYKSISRLLGGLILVAFAVSYLFK